MAQRPSANIALLRERERESKVYENFIKFPKVLTAAGYEDAVGLKLIQVRGRIGSWYYPLKCISF